MCKWAGKFVTKFSGLRETVPDTQDYILWDKIGSSIGGYSGVCEYTANTGTNTEYLVDLRTAAEGSLQCNYKIVVTKF